MTKKSIKQPKGIILKGLTISLINPEGIAKPLGLIIYLFLRFAHNNSTWMCGYIALQYSAHIHILLLVSNKLLLCGYIAKQYSAHNNIVLLKNKNIHEPKGLWIFLVCNLTWQKKINIFIFFRFVYCEW